MTIHRTFLTAAAAVIFLAFSINSPSARPRQEGPSGPPNREDLMETVEIYMMAKMKRFLELDDEQSKIVIPIVEELNSSRRDFRRRHRGMLRQLQPLIDDTTQDTDNVVDLLDELYSLEQKHREDEAHSIESIRSSLSPVQQARFMLFQERFRKEMEQRLRGMMRDRRGGPPGGRRPEDGGF